MESLRALTGTNVNIGSRARTCEISARISIEEGDLTSARSQIEAALKLVGDHQVPLTAWRVHAAASALYKKTGDAALANEHLATSKSILSQFAETFDDDEPLRHCIFRVLKR